MILIADNTYRKMRVTIREKLLSECIPCAVANTDRIDAYLPAALIIVTEKYIYKDVKYLSDMHEFSPIVVFDEVGDFTEYVRSVYDTHCRGAFEGERSKRVIFDNGDYYFCSRKLYMTKTEKRILRALLSRDEWISAEHLSYYCLKRGRYDQKSIAVHVCNLNKKVRSVTGHDLILHRRYEGYRINEF